MKHRDRQTNVHKLQSLEQAIHLLVLLSSWDLDFIEKTADGPPHAGGRMTLDVRDSRTGEVTHLAPGILVNAAGLQAQEVAGVLRGLPAKHVPKRHLARGCYFSLSGRAPAVQQYSSILQTCRLSSISGRRGLVVQWLNQAVAGGS